MISWLLLKFISYSKQGFVHGGHCQVESWKSDCVSPSDCVSWLLGVLLVISSLLSVFHFGNRIDSLKYKASVSFGEGCLVGLRVVAGGFWQHVFHSDAYDFEQVHSCYL